MIQIDTILNSSNNRIEESDGDSESDNDSTINDNENPKAKICSKNDNLELINEIILNLDKTNSGIYAFNLQIYIYLLVNTLLSILFFNFIFYKLIVTHILLIIITISGTYLEICPFLKKLNKPVI